MYLIKFCLHNHINMRALSSPLYHLHKCAAHTYASRLPITSIANSSHRSRTYRHQLMCAVYLSMHHMGWGFSHLQPQLHPPQSITVCHTYRYM